MLYTQLKLRETIYSNPHIVGLALKGRAIKTMRSREEDRGRLLTCLIILVRSEQVYIYMNGPYDIQTLSNEMIPRQGDI